MAATGEEDRRMQIDENEVDAVNIDSSSDDSDSGDEEVATPVEWLATGREKRATAGNRLKSMIAAEEPDDELELLFAEDGSDEGFTDVEDDASDVHMDSSSDEEDAQENGDELEGENELERQNRESRQAARKRKAQEAIPLKFRKKVKIDTSRTGSSTPTAPKPRPKKKSERTSWLPSLADMPTRASKRETTMLGKEHLHKQMIEREVKRLKQVEAMERKAKKMEALKKPPMTQAQRLAEAALVEKKNAKSVNRWEEAEKQREEERKAKLAALNNRTLEGPVVTFWSGFGEWIDGRLKHVGKIVTIEEKPAKKKRNSGIGNDEVIETPSKEKPGDGEPAQAAPKEKVDNREPAPTPSKDIGGNAKDVKEEKGKDGKAHKEIEVEKPIPPTEILKEPPQPAQTTAPEKSPVPLASTPQKTETSPSIQNLSSTNSQAQEPKLLGNTPQVQDTKPKEARPQAMKPPDMIPPSTSPYTTSMFAPPQTSPLMKPPELKPPSSSYLAPPPGATQSGLSMPVLGYHSTPTTNCSSNVLAHPNTAQRQSPLSMPQPQSCPPPAPAPPRPTQPTHAPTPTSSQALSHTPIKTVKAPPKTPLSTLRAAKANSQKHQPKEVVPPPPPSPPANGKATRNCIILQKFNENAVKEKAVQNQILFGKDMSKLGKQAPPPRCVITNHLARYRDPRTGLPYYNAYAYREIQKLQHGDYKWSRLVGAWTGSGSYAATGVPARFLDPDAPGPPKPAEPKESPKKQDVSEPPGGTVESAEKQAAPGPSSVAAAPAGTNEPTTQTADTTTATTSTLSTKPVPSVDDPSVAATAPSSIAMPATPSTQTEAPTPSETPLTSSAAVAPASTTPIIGGETAKQ